MENNAFIVNDVNNMATAPQFSTVPPACYTMQTPISAQVPQMPAPPQGFPAPVYQQQMVPPQMVPPQMIPQMQQQMVPPQMAPMQQAQPQQQIQMPMQPRQPAATNNKGNKKNSKPNYFERSRQRSNNTDDWLNNIQQIERDIPLIVKDIIYGSIKEQDVVQYFLGNENFSSIFRSKVGEKYMMSCYRTEAAEKYMQWAKETRTQVPESYRFYISCDTLVFNIWQAVQRANIELAEISKGGLSMAVSYFMNTFQPMMMQQFGGVIRGIQL